MKRLILCLPLLGFCHITESSTVYGKIIHMDSFNHSNITTFTFDNTLLINKEWGNHLVPPAVNGSQILYIKSIEDSPLRLTSNVGDVFTGMPDQAFTKAYTPSLSVSNNIGKTPKQAPPLPVIASPAPLAYNAFNQFGCYTCKEGDGLLFH